MILFSKAVAGCHNRAKHYQTNKTTTQINKIYQTSKQRNKETNKRNYMHITCEYPSYTGSNGVAEVSPKHDASFMLGTNKSVSVSRP